jgi:hypothetical protein
MSEENKENIRLNSRGDEMLGRYISMEVNKVEADTICPSEEDLAAFIDNTIDYVERDRIAGHLSSCNDCYEVFSVATELQEEVPGEVFSVATELQEEVPGESWFSVKSIIFRYVPYSFAAAAAVFLIMISGISLLYDDKLSFVGDRVAVLAEDVDKESIPYLFRQEPADLYGFADMSSGEGSAFRTGVYLADLELALLLDDKASALRLLSELVVLLKAAKGTDESITLYKNMEIEIGKGASLKQFTGRAEKTVPGVEEPLYVRFGQWCEGGRIAAIERKSKFYFTDDVGTFIKEFESAGLPKGLLDSLYEIKRAVIEEAYTEKQFRKLQREFESLILLF